MEALVIGDALAHSPDDGAPAGPPKHVPSRLLTRRRSSQSKEDQTGGRMNENESKFRAIIMRTLSRKIFTLPLAPGSQDVYFP